MQFRASFYNWMKKINSLAPFLPEYVYIAMNRGSKTLFITKKANEYTLTIMDYINFP